MAQALRHRDSEGTVVPEDTVPEAGRDAARNAEAQDGQTSRSKQPKINSPPQEWLNWQCKMIAGVAVGAVFDVSGKKLRTIKAGWPDRKQAQSELLEVAQKALESSEVQILSQQTLSTGEPELFDYIAVPVVTQHSIYVVAMRIVSRSQSQQQAVVQLLQWGGLWLGTIFEMGFGATASNDPQSSDNSLLGKVLAGTSVQASCVELVNALAAELNCERVSIGFKHRLNIKLKAISQLSDFDSKRQLVRSIEAAMSEAVDQDTSMLFPASGDVQIPVTTAHSELQHQNGQLACCTILLQHNDEVIGALLCERDSAQPFSQSIQHKCENLLADIAPVLALKLDLEQPLIPTVLSDARSGLRKILLGDTRASRIKRAGVCVAAILIGLFPVQHKVVATASVEGADKQVLVAPQAGYIKSASVRAGDLVAEGDTIATLDDRNLAIERNKWLGELAKIETSFAQALGTRNRSEVGLLQARKQQAQAELDLINQKLDRSVLRAPFDGVLVSGDLNQSLGAPVAAGEVLFEIASLENYRLLLEIDEHDVAGVTEGQAGHLRISALPGRTYATTIKSVMPVAVSRNKRTVFQLEANLDETSRVLRPGMRGVAKINLGRRSLIWVLTHGLLDRVRLWLWAVGF